MNDSDTSNYVEFIITNYNKPIYGGNNDVNSDTIESINFNKNNIESEMLGGGKKKSSRKKKKSSRNKLIKQSSRSKFKKQSSELHDRAVDEIMKLNYSIEDAKLIKAGLYNMVKEKYPDLNNYARAEKLLELVTKENIEKINLSKLKKLIEKNKKEKETQKDEKKVSKK